MKLSSSWQAALLSEHTNLMLFPLAHASTASVLRFWTSEAHPRWYWSRGVARTHIEKLLKMKKNISQLILQKLCESDLFSQSYQTWLVVAVGQDQPYVLQWIHWADHKVPWDCHQELAFGLGWLMSSKTLAQLAPELDSIDFSTHGTWAQPTFTINPGLQEMDSCI